MAISTYKVFLMYKAEGADSYSKLCDIKSYPDLGGTPELLDTTTLTNKSRTGIPGIFENDSLDFTANYDKADFGRIKALEQKQMSFAVWFGGTESGETVTPTGDNGKFNFDGELTVYAGGGGVNEVVDMTISITPSTTITFVEA